MDIEQRLEVLIQIIRDYKLIEHVELHRHEYEKQAGKAGNVGSDLSLLSSIVNGEGMYPAQYWMAMLRACERLGIPLDIEEAE